MIDAVQSLLGWAEREPQRPLLIAGGRTYSYADVVRQAVAVAAHLHEAGLERGQRVAMLLEEYDSFFVSMYAIWLAGGVAVPLNTSLPAGDIEWLIGKAQPTFLLVPASSVKMPAGAAQVAAATPASPVPARLVVDLPEAPSPSSAFSPVRADETAMVMFTSGTTGVPKGVRQTLAGISANAGHVAVALGLTAEDRIFINTPPYFTSGICHFLTLLAAGGSTVGRAGFFFGQSLLDEMEAMGCTGFGGAPAHLVRVVEPLEEARPTGSLRFWVSSGDHLPPRVIERTLAVLPGVALFNMYGLTEVSGRLCVLPPAELARREGSVGRPIHDMTVTVRQPDLSPAAAGEVGEIYVGGPLVMQGYLDEPEITARTLTAHGLRTGDFGRQDQDGYLWIEGRQDDIFKRGGEKVSTVHIQQGLMSLGMFRDAAVLSVEDEILGRVPVAFVVPAGSEPFKGTQVLKQLKSVLPATHLPSRVVALEAIPRTGSGKAIQAQLLAALEER